MTEEEFKIIKVLFGKACSLRTRISDCQDKIQRNLNRLKLETIPTALRYDCEVELEKDIKLLNKLKEEFKNLK